MAKTLPGSMTRRRTRITTERKIADDEFMAAAIGDLDWLKQSIRDRREQTWDKNGLSALHLAALHGRLDCLTYLLEVCHYDVNLSSSTGWRPVHLAISSTTGKRAFQCLLYLLDKGADPSVGNDDGITPCHQAASEGHVNCLRLLLEVGASVEGEDYRGHTALDLAKLWGHKKCARMIANRMWNQDKNYVAREIDQLRRMRLQQVATEVEAEEERMAEKQFYGDMGFKDWLEKKNLSGRPTGPRDTDQRKVGIDYAKTDAANTSQSELGPNSDNRIKPNFQESLHKANSVATESSTTTKDNKGILRIVSPDGYANKQQSATTSQRKSSFFSDSSIEWKYTSHDAIHDMIQSSEEIVGPKGDATMLATPGYVNPIPWSKYGSLAEKPYVKTLDDDYPRDQYTMMAKSQGKYFDGKCAKQRQKPVKSKKTSTGGIDSAKQKYEPPKVPDLPDDIIRRMLAKDASELQRPVLFKSKHIADVNKRKKFVNEAPRSEASLHLGNDTSSVLFNQGLQSAPVLPEMTPSNKSSSSSRQSTSTSGTTADVDVFNTLRLLGVPQRYPAIKGPEYVLG